jgi:hypothetical protein
MRVAPRSRTGSRVENLWATVDRLIHDLGAIRAFVDEAEAAGPEPVAPVATVRSAMDEATTAITQIFTHSEPDAVEAAGHAIARAQDAMRDARRFVAEARAGRDAAARMRQQAQQPAERARSHFGEGAERPNQLRASYETSRRRLPNAPPPSNDDASRD